MRDSFFPDDAELTRTLAAGALKGPLSGPASGAPRSAADAARAFVANLLRPAPPPVDDRGAVTLLMAVESAQHKRALVRQVVRWHNRHPLAKRISHTDINGFGSASLPFSAPQAGGQRFALFDDVSLLPGLGVSRLAAFALAHGHTEQPGARHWARREVAVAPGWNPAHAQQLHLQVAALKTRRKQIHRVLVGLPPEPGAAWPVLGQRLWSAPRMAVAGALAALPLVGAALWLAPLAQRASPAIQPVAPIVAQAPAPAAVPLPVLPSPAPAQAPRAVMPPAAEQAPALPAAPLPGTPTLGEPIEHATDPLRLSAAQPGQRNGPPLRLGLIGAIGADQAEQLAFQANLRSALAQLGSHTGRLDVGVIGTPDGDAVTVWPFDNEAAAQRVGQALRARGMLMRLAEI